MDIEALMTQQGQGMRTFTDEQRQVFVRAEAKEYGR